MLPFINWGANNLVAFIMLYSIVTIIRRMEITFVSHKIEIMALIMIPYSTAVISIIGLDLLGKKIPLIANYSCYFLRGNYRPVSMMVSIGLFLWSISWNIKNNKVINYLGEKTFGIYLFHMYPINMTLLFEKLFSLQQVIKSPYAVLWCISVVTFIFVVGVVINSLRRVLFYCCDFLINLFQIKKLSIDKNKT